MPSVLPSRGKSSRPGTGVLALVLLGTCMAIPGFPAATAKCFDAFHGWVHAVWRAVCTADILILAAACIAAVRPRHPQDNPDASMHIQLIQACCGAAAAGCRQQVKLD